MRYLVIYLAIGLVAALTLLPERIEFKKRWDRVLVVPRLNQPFSLTLGEMLFQLLFWPVTVGYYLVLGVYAVLDWMLTKVWTS